MPGEPKPRKPPSPWRRRLRFTREGWYFSLVTVGVGLAAINTGNNLLYLVLGLLLSLIIVSGILSESSLRSLTLSRTLPSRAEAARPVLVAIVLRNDKRRLRTYSVEVEDLLQTGSVGKRCYFLRVAPGGSQSATYQHTFPTRGLHRYRGFRVSTRFPFGLFEKSLEVASVGEVVVYPPRVPVPDVAPPPSPGYGDLPARRVGHGTDFHALRDYVLGDEPRTIHWRSSARMDRLLVRSSEEDTRHGVRVYLDNTLPAGGPAVVDAARPELERAVSLAASLCVDLARRGLRVTLVTRSGVGAEVTSPSDLDDALACLALLPLLEADAAPAPRLRPPPDVVIAHALADGRSRAGRVLLVGTATATRTP